MSTSECTEHLSCIVGVLVEGMLWVGQEIMECVHDGALSLSRSLLEGLTEFELASQTKYWFTTCFRCIYRVCFASSTGHWKTLMMFILGEGVENKRKLECYSSFLRSSDNGLVRMRLE